MPVQSSVSLALRQGSRVVSQVSVESVCQVQTPRSPSI